jgi:hypothetical protein
MAQVGGVCIGDACTFLVIKTLFVVLMRFSEILQVYYENSNVGNANISRLPVIPSGKKVETFNPVYRCMAIN